jgi:hypothetical protein
MGTLNENPYTFLIISRLVDVRMRNVSDKICRENQNTHFVFNTFSPESLVVYDIMWQNIVELGRRKMTHGYCMLDIVELGRRKMTHGYCMLDFVELGRRKMTHGYCMQDI